MEITARGLWTMIHGMGFGALYLLACSGALAQIYRCCAPGATAAGRRGQRFLGAYLVVMAVLAWLTVFTGAYVIYPWYRALPPAGTSNLADFPQRLLMSNPATIGWHSIGMEWKEYLAWLVPISITMAAAVCLRYGPSLRNFPQLRRAVLGFIWVSLLAALIAGFFGAMLVMHAPVEGGAAIRLMQGEMP